MGEEAAHAYDLDLSIINLGKERSLPELAAHATPGGWVAHDGGLNTTHRGGPGENRLGRPAPLVFLGGGYSTVTLLARLRGLSISRSSLAATW
jgi:hypothetical protein